MRSVIGLSVVIAGFLPAAALGQDASRTDPSADSPSGAIYEIPLERARDDAAPRAGGGSQEDAEAGGLPAGGTGDGGAGGTAETPTSIKSENGFGSSATVPGFGVVGSTGGNAAAGSDLVRLDGTEDAPPEGSAYLLLAVLTIAPALGGAAVARRTRLG